MDEAARAFEAQIEVWQMHGRRCADRGGGAVAIPGARLMSSGLPFPQWSSGDVDDPARLDLDGARAWYGARAAGRGVPWGLRLPAGTPFAHGRLLFRKRLMALARERLRPAALPPGVALRPAAAADLDLVAAIDARAFENPPEQSRAWLAHQLGAADFGTVVAMLAGAAVGVATAVRSGGRAGDCCGIYGVAVLPEARRRGIAAAMTSQLLARAFDGGATLAHLNPDSDEAARLYQRLGFVEVAGMDIYTEL